jgi:hypothetical protein
MISAGYATPRLAALVLALSSALVLAGGPIGEVQARKQPPLRQLWFGSSALGSLTVTGSPTCQATKFCKIKRREGSLITVTAVPEEGGRFISWTDYFTGRQSSQCRSNVPRCRFKVSSKTIGIRSNFGEDEVSPPPPPDPPPPVSNVTINIEFYGDGNGTVSGTGASCRAPTKCTVTRSKNSVLSLSAGASSGSSFVAWYGECKRAGNGCEVTFDRSKTIYVEFDRKPAPFLDMNDPLIPDKVQAAVVKWARDLFFAEYFASQLTTLEAPTVGRCVRLTDTSIECEAGDVALRGCVRSNWQFYDVVVSARERFGARTGIKVVVTGNQSTVGASVGSTSYNGLVHFYRSFRPTVPTRYC